MLQSCQILLPSFHFVVRWILSRGGPPSCCWNRTKVRVSAMKVEIYCRESYRDPWFSLIQKIQHFRKVIWHTSWHVYWRKYTFETKARACVFIAFDKKPFESTLAQESEGDLDYMDGLKGVFTHSLFRATWCVFSLQSGFVTTPKQGEFAFCFPRVRINQST